MLRGQPLCEEVRPLFYPSPIHVHEVQNPPAPRGTNGGIGSLYRPCYYHAAAPTSQAAKRGELAYQDSRTFMMGISTSPLPRGSRKQMKQILRILDIVMYRGKLPKECRLLPRSSSAQLQCPRPTPGSASPGRTDSGRIHTLDPSPTHSSRNRFFQRQEGE